MAKTGSKWKSLPAVLSPDELVGFLACVACFQARTEPERSGTADVSSLAKCHHLENQSAGETHERDDHQAGGEHTRRKSRHETGLQIVAEEKIRDAHGHERDRQGYDTEEVKWAFLEQQPHDRLQNAKAVPVGAQFADGSFGRSLIGVSISATGMRNSSACTANAVSSF